MPKRIQSEKIKARARERAKLWYHANRQRALKTSRSWYRRNHEMVKARSKAWRIGNLERCKASAHAYYVAHKKEHICRSKLWFHNHPGMAAEYGRRTRRSDKGRTWWRSYYEKNKGAIKARAQAHYWRNRSKHIAMAVEWSRRNPLTRAAVRRNRRAGKGRVSKGIEITLMHSQRGKCAYCRRSLAETGFHLDHIHPLKLGGKHNDENIQLTCPRCNQRKGAKPHAEFAKIIERTNNA
jgi:5-methylcytosine-specific restriction endonuclease McrA